MRAHPYLALGSILALVAVCPSWAQTQAEVQAAAAVPLDLSTSPTAVAVQATEAAKATPTKSAPAGVVDPVAVGPQSEGQAKVVASTAATPLASPDFKADGKPAGPPTVGLGQNAVAGKVLVDNPPPSGGLLKANPSLVGGPKRSAVGVAAQF